MGLKRIIAKLEDVDEKLRPLYKEKEGKWFLDLDGEDDGLAALKNALERTRLDNDALKRERDSALEAAKQKGEDVTSLEASYKGKLAEASKHESDALKSLQTALKNATFGQTASELAFKLGGEANAEILKPHIEKRLKMELDGETPIVRVLDKDGKMSASSITDLENEFRANKAFAAVLTGSRGSGVSDPPKQPQGSAQDTGSSFNPNTANPAALAAWISQRSQARGA